MLSLMSFESQSSIATLNTATGLYNRYQNFASCDRRASKFLEERIAEHNVSFISKMFFQLYFNVINIIRQLVLPNPV